LPDDHRQQLLYALDEQVRRYESEGKIKKYDTGIPLCRARRKPHLPRHLPMDLRLWKSQLPRRRDHRSNRRIGAIFGKSTNSVV